ncbi:VTT domain-containing protein [Patescibacteria group bacterium]|nr:VTT domain-containing protein [Patescibacteria group bacterium]
MSDSLTKFLIALVLRHKYFFLFPAVVIEGPVVTMASGFFVSLHILNPWFALPIIVVADVTGDVLYYAIGWFGNNWTVTRWIVKKLNVDKVKNHAGAAFERHGGKILLFGKLTHVFGVVFLVGAGYVKMSLAKFIKYNALGTVIKSSALMGVGYFVGAAYEIYGKDFETGTFAAAAVSLGAIATLLYYAPHVFKKMISLGNDIDM